MWIFDSYFKGCVTMWGRERGLTRPSLAYPPSFYMHLKDPHAHGKMIVALESRFKAEECSFRTIYGTLKGYRIHADRKIAEKIEIQTYLPGRALQCGRPPGPALSSRTRPLPCGDRDESRFSPYFQVPLTSLELQVAGDPAMPREISRVEVLDGCKRILQGPEQTVLSDLLDLVKSHDPDLILCPTPTPGSPLWFAKPVDMAFSPHSAAQASSSRWPQSPTGAMAR